MALGKPTECWICWESKAYRKRDRNMKQLCVPIKGKKGTLVAGMLMWLCKECALK